MTTLFNKSYEENRSELLEQYKLYFQSIENISERRIKADNLFLTTNAVLVTLNGLISSEQLSNIPRYVTYIIPVVGIIISFVFFFLINSYKQINTGKFKVLHKIETKLPVNLFTYEWEVLEHGENKKVYFPFSHIEKFIPIIFGGVYLISLILFLFL